MNEPVCVVCGPEVTDDDTPMWICSVACRERLEANHVPPCGTCPTTGGHQCQCETCEMHGPDACQKLALREAWHERMETMEPKNNGTVTTSVSARKKGKE